MFPWLECCFLLDDAGQNFGIQIAFCFVFPLLAWRGEGTGSVHVVFYPMIIQIFRFGEALSSKVPHLLCLGDGDGL